MADTKGIDWGALLLGAGDELLFGFPEWAGKNLAGPEVRKKIETWISEHPQYHTGEFIGNVASIFVPVGGALKAGKLADKVLDAAKITGAVARPAAKAALAAGTEGAVRAFTSEMPATDIAKSALISGAAGGAIGAATAPFASRAADLADDAVAAANRAELASQGILTKKDAVAFMREYAGRQSKGFGRKTVSEEALAELARVSREIQPQYPGNLDRAISANRAVWAKASDSYNQLFPGRAGFQLIVDAATQMQDDIPQMAQKTPGGIQALQGAMQDILKKTKDVKGVENTRKVLQDLYNATYKSMDETAAQATRDIISKLRQNVDENLIDAVWLKTGDVGFKDALAKAKRDYLPMRFIADADARADLAISKTSVGSTTAEKLGMNKLAANIIEGGGGATGFGILGYATSAAEDPAEKMKDALKLGAVGLVSGPLANVGSRLVARSIDKLSSVIMPEVAEALTIAAPTIARNTDKVVTGAGRAAGLAARTAIGPDAPKSEAEAAKAGAAAATADVFGQGQKYKETILSSMKQYYEANGFAEKYGPQGFQQFVAVVASQTDNFSPRKMASVFYKTEEERAAYLKAVDVAEKIGQSWDTGLRKPYGFFDSPSNEERSQWIISRDRLMNAIGDAGSKTGSAKIAKEEASKILNSNDDATTKRKKIEDLLRLYGVDMSYLSRFGL